MKAIIGKKVGMSQIFDENGKVIPVTVIEAGPCVVVQKKTAEKDGYNAVQLGYEDIPERKLTKPEMGHLNKAGVAPKKYLREFNLDNAAELNVGDIVKADTFKEGDFVDVTGTSKGHGYQGVIKRWGAQRTPTSHGGGPVHRHAGSMGSTTDPSRIFKGKIGAAVVAVRRGGATHVYDTINHMFLMSRMIVPGSTYWNMGYGSNEKDVLNDSYGMENMNHLGRTIAWLGKATAPHLASFPA